MEKDNHEITILQVRSMVMAISALAEDVLDELALHNRKASACLELIYELDELLNESE